MHWGRVNTNSVWTLLDEKNDTGIIENLRHHNSSKQGVKLEELWQEMHLDEGDALSYGGFLEAGERRTQAAADVLSRRFECRLDASRRREGGKIYANRVTWGIVSPKSEDVSHRIPVYLPHPASPIITSHPWMARIAVTLYVTYKCLHPIG